MQDTQKEIWLELAGERAAAGPYIVGRTTTARELLASAGLQGWWLETSDGGNFAYEDLLFDRVTDQQRLRVANADAQEVRKAGMEASDASELPADAAWREHRL
jgi:hypothetical protein